MDFKTFYNQNSSVLRALLCFIAFVAFMGAQYGAIYERDEVSKILVAYGVGLLALMVLFVMAPGKPPIEYPLVPSSKSEPHRRSEKLQRMGLLLLSFAFAALAWLNITDNFFTWLNVSAWWASVVAFFRAFWPWEKSLIAPDATKGAVDGDEGRASALTTSDEGRASALTTSDGDAGRAEALTTSEAFITNVSERAKAFIASLLTRQMAALLLLVAIGVFFRAYRLAEVPPEMNSDHVEKLLDVHDVLTDKTYIFFERNTGREPMQFYLVTAIIRTFDTGLTFYSLKLSNFVMGMLTIWGVYLLGREVGGRRVAWVAAFFAAVALWSFAPSRVGLRYPFAPAFTSLALWSLWRALRTGETKDWLVGGLMLGLGLHGYTSFRIMPLAATLTVLLKIVIERPRRWQQWRQYVQNFTLYVATSALVFLPLGRYWYDNPDMFWYRSLTRSTSLEEQITEPLWSLAAQTFLRTLGMFQWVGDNVFVSTIAQVPVLNPITNGFFVIGLGYTLVVLSRQRPFVALALLLNGFILLMPSMLNFAFPNESPSVVRTGSAIPVMAVIFALGTRYVYQQFAFPSRQGRTASTALVGLLLLAIAVINYNRYFGTYLTNYQQRSMNTAEVAAKMSDFLSLVGDTDHIFIKGWPHWLDTRALGIQIGDVDWGFTHASMDLAPLIERAPKDGSPILFIVHPGDMGTRQTLQRLYPNSFSITYRSATPDHDYIFVVVPATEPLIYEP